MSREIKFRAWHTGIKKMLHFENPLAIADGEDRYGMFLKSVENKMYIGGTFELMQYTGLPDKNGVEIYEGDIIPVYEKGQEYKYKVIYDGDCFMLSMLDSEQGSYPLSVKNRISEVIGNIYENPELSKEEPKC